MCNCDNIHPDGTLKQVTVQTVKRYSVTVYRGQKGDKGDSGTGGWQPAETIEVPVSVSIVTDDQLLNDIGPIIHLSDSPVNYVKAGIVHDKAAGTLDFTNYKFGSEFEGYIDLQIKTA